MKCELSPSFKLNILRRSRILAARLWAIDAIRRLVFLLAAEVEGFEDEFDGVKAVRGDESRCETKFPTWLLGQIAEKSKKLFSHFSSKICFSHPSLESRWCHCTLQFPLGSTFGEMELRMCCRRLQRSANGSRSKFHPQNVSFYCQTFDAFSRRFFTWMRTKSLNFPQYFHLLFSQHLAGFSLVASLIFWAGFKDVARGAVRGWINGGDRNSWSVSTL